MCQGRMSPFFFLVSSGYQPNFPFVCPPFLPLPSPLLSTPPLLRSVQLLSLMSVLFLESFPHLPFSGTFLLLPLLFPSLFSPLQLSTPPPPCLYGLPSTIIQLAIFATVPFTPPGFGSPCVRSLHPVCTPPFLFSLRSLCFTRHPLAR